MTEQGLFGDEVFRQTAALILGTLAALSILIFAFRKKGTHMMAGWASLKSWIFIAPLILLVLALPEPWPLVLLTVTGISSAKTFFQMVGIFQRSWFIWTTYLFIIWLGYLTYQDEWEIYNLSPMIFLGTIWLIPLIRNSAAHMIQYIALTLLAFIFFGWSLMHLGLLLMMEGGAFIVLYLYLLTEVSDNITIASSRLFGRLKPFDKISQRVSVEGIVISIVVALLMAWGMRHLLPERSDKYWIAAGLVAAVIGRLGGLILSVIRRDLGIKNSESVFIFGRDDILSRVDKLIFVGPIYFYIYLYLRQASWI